MTRLTALKEVIFGAPEPQEIKKSTTVVISSTEEHYGARLSTSLKDQLQVYNEDGLIKQKILEFAQEVISTGFFTTFNEKYTLKLGGKTAKETIDDWNRVNDLDGKLSQMAAETPAFGNSIWQITSDGFVNVPIEAIEKAVPVDKTTPVREKYDLQLTGEYASKKLKWGEFMHCRINLTGKAPLGSGIILGLIAYPDADTPSLYDARKIVRASIADSFTRFSKTNSLWSFPEASDDAIKILGAKLENMEQGQRITTNVKGSISLEIPERTSSFDKWIEEIDKEFYAALGTGITPDTEYTTKATAEAIREYYEMRISNLRRVIKRVVEAIWVKVLDQLGFDGEKAEIRLFFGPQQITEYQLTDIFQAVTQGVLSKLEARKLLREYCGWKIENVEQLPEVQTPKQPPEGEKP